MGEEKRRGAEKVDAIVAFVEGSMGLRNSLTAEPASGSTTSIKLFTN